MAQKKKRVDRGQRIIANMGVFWSKAAVQWKGRRDIGRARLAGKRRSAKKRGLVNFWKQTGIYALYADYHLVYVGQAGLTDKSCIGNRLKQHLTDDLSGRWNKFSWFGLQAVTKQNKLEPRRELSRFRKSHLANVLEGVLIEIAEPPMNSQKGRFGRRVERFIQEDDGVDPLDEARKEIDVAICNLTDQLEEGQKQLKTNLRQVAKRLERKLGGTKKRLARAIKRVSK